MQFRKYLQILAEGQKTEYPFFFFFGPISIGLSDHF